MEEIPQEKESNKELDDKDKGNFDTSSIPLIKKGRSENLIDQIYEKNCFNKYSMFVIFSIGMFFIADGMEMCFMNLFIIPIKVYFDLTEFEVQCLASMIFVGAAIGGFISGYMSQYIGRVYTVMISSLLLVVSHILMAIATNFGMFLIFRILIGIALGVIVPISLNNLSEYLPIYIRGFMLVFIWTFFQIGMLLQGCVCYVAMPNLEVSKLKNVMMFLTLFPLLSLAVNLFCFYDSPRTFIVTKKEKPGLEILSHIKGKELTEYEANVIIEQVLKQGNDTTSGIISDLFKKDYLCITLLSIGVFFISTTLFYGLYIISTLTVQQIGVDKSELSNRDIIAGQLIIAGSNTFSLLTAGFMCEIKLIGRKGAIWGSFIFTAIFAIPCVYFPKLYTLFFSIFIFFTTIAFNVMTTYVVEIYPTKLRDISSGFLFFTLRVSGLISQFLMLGLFKLHHTIPYYLCAILSIIGIVFTLLLPHDTINQPLDRKYEEEKLISKEEQDEKLIEDSLIDSHGSENGDNIIKNL